MQTIRSFIAIPIPTDIQKSAGNLVRRLSSPGDGIKWVPAENLHLTLKFLGDVDNREIPRICDVVRACCADEPAFLMEFFGVDAFPSAERPRVVYAGLRQGGEPLKRIVDALEKQLADLGFKPEPRDYVPHMTLGRTRGGSRRGSGELRERLAHSHDATLGNTVADRVLLMASFLDNAGPTYQVMDTIPLSAP